MVGASRYNMFAKIGCLTALAALSFASPVAAQSDGAAPSATAAPAAAQVDAENILYLDLSSGGRVTIQLNPQVAPNHVERIKTLARQGFYNGIVFHRVIPGEIAQGGDPTGTGRGSSELPDIKAEFSKTPHLRGTISMARAADPDSANSQFFICLRPTFFFDNKYTVFGRVTSGMQFVDAIAPGEPPANPTRILQASIAADNKPAPDFNLAAAPAETKISVDDLGAN